MLVPVYEPPPSQTEDAVYGMRLKNVLSAGVTILIRVNYATHLQKISGNNRRIWCTVYGSPCSRKW